MDMQQQTKLKLLLLLTSIVKVTVILNKNMKKRKNRKKLWCRNWLKRRTEGRGVLNMLNEELRVEDPPSYRNFLRLSNEQFEFILKLVEHDLRKQATNMRDAIYPRNKLEITHRFLATGETYRSLMYNSRIHESTISKFIPTVCKAIVNKFKNFIQTPNTVEAWKKIAQDFYNIWQFPHALGALDGRHITFRPPISDGSYYYNYKGTHSIVLLALVDAHYKFTYVNIGVNGRISDGGVFHQTALSKALLTNKLNFPPAEPLASTNIIAPYVIIADDAFPLSEHLLKPYPFRNLDHDSKIFNYRLSRARRIVENAFGILANRFRILLNPINLSVDKVELITLTCVILHNYLATENGTSYTDICDDTPQNLTGIGQQAGNYSNNNARNIRDIFKRFFNSAEGKVDWQERAIREHNM